MKKIKLRPEMVANGERINSTSLLRLVTMSSPTRALSVEEIRHRVRILDALDAAQQQGGDMLTLEDADHKVLCLAIENYPWSQATRPLLTIIDDVLKPDVAPAPMKLVEPARDS